MSIGKIVGKIAKNLRAIRCWALIRLHGEQRYVVVSAPLFFKAGKLKHVNWGDDMNYYFVNLLSKKEILHLQDAKILKLLQIPSFLVIGSTISFYSLDNMTIWGAGLINENRADEIRGTPHRILAVRGPKTRQVMLEKGYDCPEVYGDPVLLLPCFYTPKEKKAKWTFGIVPHYSDRKKPIVHQLEERGCKIIEVQNYSRWQDFVDDICSCRYILSSSLHGLIVSEAYGVPSLWAGFSDYEKGWEFKFEDFYLSINKPDQHIVDIRVTDDVFGDEIREKLNRWVPGEINLDLLLSVCPFSAR